MDPALSLKSPLKPDEMDEVSEPKPDESEDATEPKSEDPTLTSEEVSELAAELTKEFNNDDPIESKSPMVTGNYGGWR